jgi:hypothetical protein
MLACGFRRFLQVCLVASIYSTVWAKGASTRSPGSAPEISIPVIFESNLGQSAPNYRFIARHADGDIRFTNAGPDFFMRGLTDQAVIQLRPVEIPGAMRVEGKQPLQAKSNYLGRVHAI